MEVYLRSLLKSDAGPMLGWMHDPRVQKSFGRDFGDMRLEDCMRFIENSQAFETDDLNLAISTRQDEYIGTVSLKHIDHTSKSSEFAIVIRPEYQRQGVGYVAMEQIARVGFNVLGLDYIYLNVKKNNEVANALYKKYGCTEVTEQELENLGIHLTKPATNEELIWYLFVNKLSQKEL